MKRWIFQMMWLGLLVVGIPAIGIVLKSQWPNAAVIRVEPSYSPDFKQQARTTLDAIDRCIRYPGRLCEYEADKELDKLRNLSDTTGEGNAVAILNYYFIGVLGMKFATPKDLAEFTRTAADLDRIRIDLLY